MLQGAGTKVQRMEYRAINIERTQQEILAQLSGGAEDESARARAELETQLYELQSLLGEKERNFQSALKAARIEAYQEGRQSQVTEDAERLGTAADQFRNAVQRFVADRDDYLGRVEQEVVQLALAIAARILHREAQMDPLLLAGAVRVALGQLAETTEVRLRVPAQEQAIWADMLRLMPNLPLRPQLVPDEQMKAGECALETHLGSVDLGIKAQLAEIERGFFDLLEHRNQLAVAPQVAGR